MELINIRKLFPWTLGVEDSLVHRIPFHKFTEMTPKTLRVDKSKQGIKDQLLSNSCSLEVPLHTGAHTDDSYNLLCPVRLDRYPRTSVREFIANAKKILPPGGVPPVDTYDLDFFGMSHSVSERGWYEIHNPGSEVMCLKMFSKANSGSAAEDPKAAFSLLANGEAIGVGESWKEIVSLSEFKQALRAYMTASFLAMPWYPAPLCLFNFLELHQYMEGVLPINQAKILTRFVNTIFIKNAKAWRTADTPPLSVEPLLVSWQHFLAENNIGSSTAIPTQDSRLRSRPSAHHSSPVGLNYNPLAPPPPISSNLSNSSYKKAAASDICIRFNKGTCPSQNKPYCFMPSRSNGAQRKLKHVCNRCSATHAAKDFH